MKAFLVLVDNGGTASALFAHVQATQVEMPPKPVARCSTALPKSLPKAKCVAASVTTVSILATGCVAASQGLSSPSPSKLLV